VTAAARVRDDALELAEGLRRAGAGEARLALVLGSGLGAFAEALAEPERIPFASLPGMPTSAVPGHAGAFVLGRAAGVPVLAQQGRVHRYEGWSPFAVTRAVRALAALGVARLVLTNAAGCLRPQWEVPGLMRIVDHVARQGAVGLLPGEARRGAPYDAALGKALDAAGAAEDVPLARGTYVGLLGPSYETPAEIRHLAAGGIDAVGMSTVAEASVAAALGLRVVGVSCLSNLGAGLSAGPLDHAEVVAAGAAVAERFVRLLLAAAPRLVAA